MAHLVTFTRYDQSGERTSTRLHLPEMTNANYDALETAVDAVAAALNGIVLSDAARRVGQVVWGNEASPDKAGNRELKWLIRSHDSVNGISYAHEVGCANDGLTVVNQAGSTYLDTTSAEFLALEAAWNANVKTRDGISLILESVELVGRNL